MRTVIAMGLLFGLGGCVAAKPLPEGLLRPFSCPTAGTRTVIEQSGGPRYTTVWLGAEPGDPLACLSENGAGRNKRSRLFGRWNFEDDMGGTTEERAMARQAVADLLSGRSVSAGFVLRGKSGEQTSQHWRIAGSEEMPIGGKTVRTIRIRINYIYSANGSTTLSDIWFAPDYGLFVRSDGTSDLQGKFIWKMVRITPPAGPAPDA